jgi:metal-responsive CopG/Arc/MetJ family transcriptional regulator
MSQRINVNLSEKLNSKLDSLSESYGISKSSIVGFIVGQWVDNMERANSLMFGKDDTSGALFDILKNLSSTVNQDNK